MATLGSSTATAMARTGWSAGIRPTNQLLNSVGIGAAHYFLGRTGLTGHGETGRGRFLGGAAGLGDCLHDGQHLPGGGLRTRRTG